MSTLQPLIICRRTETAFIFFVLNGEVEIEGQQLSKRVGFGIWNTNQVNLKSLSESRVLLMEVPMTI
jgi:hypothetical protein